MTKRPFSIAALLSMSCGMYKFQNVDPSTPAGGKVAREQCFEYVNQAQTYVGFEETIGYAAGALAVGALGGAATVENDDGSKKLWNGYRKTILLTAAVPLGWLSYKTFDNAQAAGRSASSASMALTERKDDEMWSGCLRARSKYFDERVTASEDLEARLKAAQEAAKSAKEEEKGSDANEGGGDDQPDDEGDGVNAGAAPAPDQPAPAPAPAPSQ